MIFYTVNENNIKEKQILAAGIPIDWMVTAMKKISKDYPTMDDISNILLVFVESPIKVNTGLDIAKQYKITKELQLVALPINTALSLSLDNTSFDFTGDKISFKSSQAMKERENGLPQKMTAQEMLALNWLKEGKTGTSSKTMCFKIFPQIKKYYDENNSGFAFEADVPYDNADFNRCMMFAQEVNLYPDQLEKVAKINKKWGKIIENWDTLTNLITKNDEESRKEAYNLIKECISVPAKDKKPKI